MGVYESRALSSMLNSYSGANLLARCLQHHKTREWFCTSISPPMFWIRDCCISLHSYFRNIFNIKNSKYSRVERTGHGTPLYLPPSLVNTFHPSLRKPTPGSEMIDYSYDLVKKNYTNSHAKRSPWPYTKKRFSFKIKYFKSFFFFF